MPRRLNELSESDLEFIDEVMQQYAYFRRILNEQYDVFHENQAEWQAALARFDGGKNGPQQVVHNWCPPPDQVENYLKKCETVCQREIKNFDDRIIVQHASHAGLMCLIICKMTLRPEEHVATAIDKRMAEIHNQHQPLSTLPETFSSSLTLSATSSSSAASCSIIEPVTVPQSSPQSRSLTPEEITRFMTSFDSLAGKRFVLYPDETEEITYQVASYCTIRKQYEIVFDDLHDDFIRISVDELRNMLDGSKICTSP